MPIPWLNYPVSDDGCKLVILHKKDDKGVGGGRIRDRDNSAQSAGGSTVKSSVNIGGVVTWSLLSSCDGDNSYNGLLDFCQQVCSDTHSS